MSRVPHSSERRRRLDDPVWLREQLKALVESADENADEDDHRMQRECDVAQRRAYEASAKAARHYATELRRILRGLTWSEDVAARLTTPTVVS